MLYSRNQDKLTAKAFHNKSSQHHTTSAKGNHSQSFIVAVCHKLKIDLDGDPDALGRLLKALTVVPDNRNGLRGWW